MTIKFLGAVGGVTGSNYLLEDSDYNILVDCGLFQGGSVEENKNWEDFKFNPSDIDALILTHSHIDHIGLVPKLYRDGFRGKIYSTFPTRDFAEIFLTDTQKLMAQYANDHGKDILYDLKDIEGAMSLFKPVDYHQKIDLGSNISLIFYDAGHILGSSFVKIFFDKKSIVFSGDLGNPPVPIVKDTEFIDEADYVVIESTYGDRIHDVGKNRKEELENVIEETFTKKGVVLIPAFALERTQELMYEINDLVLNSRIPKIPVYIDSPLAIKATKVYPNYIRYFDEESKNFFANHNNPLDFSDLKFVESTEESKALDEDIAPKIIIAGSGMSNGGRILFHEKVFLPIESTTLVIVGYQVKGTLGRALQDGAKNIRIYGEDISVKARVVSLDSYSAHADQPKLLYWLKKINRKVKKIFVVHGEEKAKIDFQVKIKDELGIDAYIPKSEEKIIL